MRIKLLKAVIVQDIITFSLQYLIDIQEQAAGHLFAQWNQTFFKYKEWLVVLKSTHG